MISFVHHETLTAGFIIIIIHFTSKALEGIHKRHSLYEVFTQSHRNLNKSWPNKWARTINVEFLSVMFIKSQLELGNIMILSYIVIFASDIVSKLQYRDIVFK